MKGAWKKLGLLYCPPTKNQHHKLLSHAANPLPVLIEGDVYRIYFSGRDVDNKSSVGAVDIDIVSRQVVQEHQQPFFEHGPPGSFYADGISIGNCYEVDGQQFMLFMGWQTPSNGHWRGDIGRLEINADMSLTLDCEAPFMSVDPVDPISLSYPWVMKCDADVYHMWYGSTKTWDAGNDEMIHSINYASSLDGNNWDRKGVSVPYKLDVAQAFSKPTVVCDNQGCYEMWFSYRSGKGEAYRIGYAVSNNATDWQLKLDEVGIDVSKDGWDSEMIEYPFVFEHKGERYMLYNGNGYGKSGFGLAVFSNSSID